MKAVITDATDLERAEITAAALADVLGVSDRRVRQLAEAGVLPRSTRGRHPLLESLRGFVRHQRRETAGLQHGATESFQDARARRERLQADLLELELAKARGEVAPLADVERTWSRTFATLRARLWGALPERCSRRLVGVNDESEVLAVLRGELRVALEQAATADLDDETPDDADALDSLGLDDRAPQARG